MGKRILSAIAAITTAALLSSCAPATSQAPETDTDVAATTQTELPPGFYLGEEFIEIGEFNPNKVELIDLCEEIPDEVLLEAGMINNGTGGIEGSESIICTLRAQEKTLSKGDFSLISDALTKQVFQDNDLIIEPRLTKTVPGSFFYAFPSDNASCFIATETSQGLISVVYDNPFTGAPQEDLCHPALKALESIYFQLRGK
ncbi:DUF3558 family protein [Corynebacterium maris]|uniref:DUF3558 family protein n=1 Tax=Corynebacterium maris TaxID=575200 RepID=UPI00146F55BB|nr:DUF3558 family protein [Corynebacterium maris]